MPGEYTGVLRIEGDDRPVVYKLMLTTKPKRELEIIILGYLDQVPANKKRSVTKELYSGLTRLVPGGLGADLTDVDLADLANAKIKVEKKVLRSSFEEDLTDEEFLNELDSKKYSDRIINFVKESIDFCKKHNKKQYTEEEILAFLSDPKNKRKMIELYHKQMFANGNIYRDFKG